MDKSPAEDPRGNSLCTKQRKRKSTLPVLFCILIAAGFLALCSKSSPLYPLNDWGDANCFFTVGKSILNGKVLYRDIYDQKGPLLYLIHSAAWLISHHSFFGVYLIETVFFSWFLWLTAKTLRLFLPEHAAYILLPVVAALILSSPAFCHGDSAEELCLPLLAWPLYVLVRYYKQEHPAPLPFRQFLLAGITAGCVLCIKFNLLGFHAAWLISLLSACIFRKQYKRALLGGLVLLGGILVVLLPWLLYFLVNNALSDFYTGYIYNNIFLYATAQDLSLPDRLAHRLLNIVTAFYQNLQFTVPVVLGLIAVLCTRRYSWSAAGRLSLTGAFLCLLLGVFAGDEAFRYYSLILSVFAVLGLIALWDFARNRRPRRRLKNAVLELAAFAVLCASVAFAWLSSSNTYLLGTRREDMAQYAFRDIILSSEDRTLLNYGFLDFGVYTVCGIQPTCKYFCGLNLKLPELQTAMDACILDRKTNFVVTCNETPPFILEHYTVAAQQSQYYEGRVNTYTLLERRP